MEQHPVPQQISSYEFRLVGDMTLKQFGQVAGGVLLALLFYALPLPGYLKWPLAIISAFAGIAMAFLPIEERPLQTWALAFLKACYSPTQFLWQKKQNKPRVFEEVTLKPVTNAQDTKIPQDKQKLENYLSGLSSTKNALDLQEESRLSQIMNLFSLEIKAPTWPTPPQTPPITQPVKPPEPVLQVSPQSPPVTETALPKPIMPIVQEIHEEMAPTYTPYKPPLPQNIFKKREQQKFEEAHFTHQIPLPSMPTLPNVLVGMVFDTNGKIVDGAIIEIRDSQGNPVRAFRTNKLGQFRIVTPLPNDTYEIEIDKTDLKFDIIKLQLNGDLVKPIEIKATN